MKHTNLLSLRIPPTQNIEPVEVSQQNALTSTVNLKRLYRSCRLKRRGAAAVEFAVVAPIFFLVVLGMLEMGRAIMVQQILTNASREGARLAVLDGSTATTVKTSVQTYLSAASITASAATITCSPEPSTATDGTAITVTVSIPFTSVSWLPSPFFFSSSSKLSSTAIMRRETVQ
jgi:Flp pilus assembly protein TadG